MENNNKPSEISPLVNEYGARYASSTPLFNTSNRRSVPPEVSDHYTMTNQLNPSELQYDCNYYGGCTEIAKYAGMANDVNMMAQMSQQNAGYYNNHGSVSNENLNMGRSYHQSFFNDGMNGSNIPFTQLLLMGNAAFTASANSNLSTSIGMAAKRPLLPKLSPMIHSDGENNNNSWLTDQNYNSGSGMFSTVDKIITPEVHSQVDSGVRDSNQNHYSSSTCLNNEMSQYSFLTPFQPGCDLNSTETAESDAFSSVCNPVQFTPITPNQANLWESNQHPAVKKSITIPEKEGSLVPHKGDETIEQAHSNQLLESVVDSSCAIIQTPTMETTDDDKKISMGVDLNRTPELKPAKRRKHRPKVIVEGKPKRTPKTTTSKTKEPKQNSTSKRKYASKDGSKDSRTPKADVARKTKELDASASKSCRRVLNFDIEKSGENQETIFNEQELQQKNERALNMTLESQATELPNGTDCVIRVMSVPQSGTHKKLMMENQKTTNASMTSPLMNQIFSDCTSMLEREAASPPLAATEDIQTNDQIFLGRREKKKKAKQPWNTWRNGYKPMKQEKNAELLTGVLENNCQNLEKEKQLKTLPNSFQPETAGGENNDSINTRNPLGSLLCKGVLEMNNHRNGCTQRTQFSQTYKRRKTRIDYTNSYIKPSNFTAAKDLGKVQTNRSNSGCQNLHALNADPAVLNCHFESIRTPQRRNNMVNKLMNESYFQSITSTDNANQQVSTQLQLHTNVMAPPTLSHFYDISCQPITEKCNNLQPSHSIGQGHSQTYQNCNNNVPVEKQTGEMLQEQLAPCGNQPPFKKIRGRKKQQIQPLSIDMIIHLFKNLSLNEISNRRQMQEYGILVPYKGDSAMVPYEGFEFNKKRKARPKVDLDPETDRIWKLLMGSEGVEGTNKDKEKWWEEERKVFHGRVDSFIARMHLVQGDRRFSRWKGSVVDSVIGVFLTQNVSDHLSSSAFMSMAARFPLKSTSTTKENVRANEWNKEAEICVIHQDDTTEKQEILSDVIHNQKSIIPSESCGHQSKETSETNRSLLEAQCQSLQEEYISSQDSFDSRNSQSIGGIRSCSGSNSEAEDPSTIGKPTQKNVSSSIDFLEMRKITNFGENYCHNNSGCKNGQREVGPLKSGSERMKHLNYLPSFMYSTSLDHQCMKVPVNPTTKNELSMKQKIQVPEMGCFETFSEESTTSSPSNSSTLIKAKEKDLNIISRQDFDVSSAEQNGLWGSQEMPTKDRYGFLSKDATENKRISQQHESQNECIGYGDFKLKNASTMEPRKLKRTNVDKEKMDSIDWDNLRKQVEINGPRKETEDTMDSLDYEAVRCAHVKEISDAIKERGMNNRLAERMQEFLNRLVRDHGSINLEWLRDVPPDKAKDYLLSMRGLGLKSVECVRLLTLHHVAFPVDTNVGRIAVRLGWVPLQPLPESLQLHLLELYPILETIQKYLWPRLCKLDQRTLYELHYQMITFGKVFCTKSKPNCNACPMRAECRHFASAFASARLALPGPEEKRIIHTTVPVAIHKTPHASTNLMSLPPPENNSLTEANSKIGTCEPIIEEPATPEEEHTEISERDIEDLFYEDPDEIPTIKLNIEEFSVTLQNYMHNSMEIQEGDLSKALVALNQEAASIPTPKLKNISRLRTEHQVYELPDSHPILEGLERRELDDPSPYLLAIWVPGETVNSIEPPERRCDSQETGTLCSEKTCFSCSSVREADSQTVRATILIPCRTAMRGSFPLNGTYFQVNEMFADHDSSLNPINVPRQSIWNLPRRTVYFGTSVSSIFRGLSTEAIQYCFWRGFVCVRGFDRMSRAPRPLIARLHFPASKLAKAKNDNKK